MADHIDYYFDFGSPNSYLAYHALPAIESRIGRVFVHKPALLGGVFKATNNRSPVDAYRDIPAKAAYERREMMRFVARIGRDAFRLNPYFPINTLQMMRGAHAAIGLGLLTPYMEAILPAMWERGLDMGQPAVLTQVLTEAGLPTDRLLADSQTPAVKHALIDTTQELVDRGGFGIPTFFVGDEMFFGKDRLRDVEEEFVRQRGG